MQDFENIQTQLAQEETALAATTEQIEAAQQAIADAHAQIETIQAQIQGYEQQIEKFRAHAEQVQKRIELLREYMEMAASSRVPTPPPIPQRTTPPPTPAPQHNTPPPQPAVPDVSEPAEPVASELDDVLPDLNEPDELELGNIPATTSSGPSTTDRSQISFDTMDEEMLTHELLPRTSTFEEELLLLLAYHRKAIKPKEIASRFKRLDYTPKGSTSEKNIRLQVEADHHFFESVADDRVALTDEGREEARRLLESLL